MVFDSIDQAINAAIPEEQERLATRMRSALKKKGPIRQGTVDCDGNRADMNAGSFSTEKMNVAKMTTKKKVQS